MDKAFVKSEIENGINTITFFHPQHNSLPSDILAKLAKTITAAGTNEEVKLIILKSGGNRTFCAGASFDEMIQIEDFSAGKQFFMGFANVINACRKCPKLIIGRVQGKTVGGGVGLAAAVDYCMATKFASVKLSELAVGIGPFVVGPAVERKIGLSAMSQLAINATEWQTAAWAKSKGLFTEVFETVDQLDEYLNHFTSQLINKNDEAMRLLKKIFWEKSENWDQLLEDRAELSGRLILSEAAKSAINAFKTKA